VWYEEFPFWKFLVLAYLDTKGASVQSCMERGNIFRVMAGIVPTHLMSERRGKTQPQGIRQLRYTYIFLRGFGNTCMQVTVGGVGVVRGISNTRRFMSSPINMYDTVGPPVIHELVSTSLTTLANRSTQPNIKC
jgi:hypothetical protein